MAVIGINYSGGNELDDDDNLIEKPINYESVELRYMMDNDRKVYFNSGNFVKDWFDAMKDFMTTDHQDAYLSHSSCVNHFIMDGAKYDSAYLHLDDEPVLKYVDHSDPDYLWTQRDVYERGTEFFVPEGTNPTWKELKDMCGNVPIKIE